MSSTTLDIFEAIVTGAYMYLADSAVYLLVFAFIFGGLSTLFIILQLWRKR